jgi:hypothetical protein
MRPGPGGNATFQPPEIPDSTAVVRMDLTTRAVDTVAFVKVPKVKMDVQRDDNGRVSITAQVNPLPVIDEWAVLSDGSIALVRGRDYHVDWVRADGSRESSAKIPYEWKRLTDDDKVAFIDSVKAARQRLAAANPQAGGSAAVRDSVRAGEARSGAGGGNPGGPPGEVRIMIGPGGGPPGGGGAFGGREPTFVAPSELPDYQPPFFVGAARADLDGHLWIRTTPTKAIVGGPVYDVINSKGELIERVQVPKDRTIAGFGADGVVYLLARDAAGTTTKLERARVK